MTPTCKGGSCAVRRASMLVLSVRAKDQVPAVLASQIGQCTRTRVPRGTCRVAGALRLAPVRSPGFGMPCRERAVQLVGGGGRTGTVSRGACAPGAWGRTADKGSN